MRSFSDRLGFPMIEIPELALEVHLLPATKIQFEAFLAGPEGFGDSWYEAVLALNPRSTWRRFDAANRERHFVSGLLPEDALSFAHWMGKGFDVPTVAEWRVIDAALAVEIMTSEKLSALRTHTGPHARPLLDGLVAQTKPVTLRDLSLARGGLVEWARNGSEWVGLGAPRPGFWANAWDPDFDLIRPIRPGERLSYFGCRLLRRNR